MIELETIRQSHWPGCGLWPLWRVRAPVLGSQGIGRLHKLLDTIHTYSQLATWAFETAAVM